MNQTMLRKIGFSLVVGSLMWASNALAETSVPVNSMADSDNDGMPDEWEIKYGFQPNDPSDASLDYDCDGLSNLEEYKAGSNPLVADRPPMPMAQAVALAPVTSQTLSPTNNRAILYDVSFSTPPNTLGGTPVYSSLESPRTTPTYYWPYGGQDAFVESALGALTNQPLVFRSGGQIELKIDDLPRVYEV